MEDGSMGTGNRLRRRVMVILFATCLVAASSAGAAARVSPAASPQASRATCTADEQAANQAALAAYLKRMPLDRKAYFRKHHDKAHRTAFLKRQQAKLKALRAAAACQVETPAPPATPPPPPYQSGHYAGKTSQQEDFEFDVSADGTTLMNLVTGQINESCQDFNLFGGNIHATGNITSISSDGNFSITDDYSGTFSNDGTPFQRHLAITGHLSGTSATGTLLETTTATIQGTPESCTSNAQTWSASKTG
jgi:hypothetical protein